MLSDRELWACAHQVLGQHGEEALQFVVERIGQLIIDKDDDGVLVWQAIAKRILELHMATRTKH